MKIILKDNKINKQHPLIKKLLIKLTYIDRVFIDVNGSISNSDFKFILNRHKLCTPKILKQYPELLEYFI